MKAATKQAFVILPFLVALGCWGSNAWNHHLLEKKAAESRVQLDAKRHTKIEGQAFIITNKGDSVKLGDAFVSAVRKADFDNALVDAMRLYKAEMEDEDKQISTFSSLRDKMAQVLMSATSDSDRSFAAQTLKLDNESLANFTEMKNRTIESVLDNVDMSVRKLNSSRTDADGRFHIEIDATNSNFFLFAITDRKIPGQSEPLIWVVSGLFVSSPLLLSNSNLFRADNLRAPPSPPMPETIYPIAAESSSLWWAKQITLLCGILAVAILAFMWLNREQRAQGLPLPQGVQVEEATWVLAGCAWQDLIARPA